MWRASIALSFAGILVGLGLGTAANADIVVLDILVDQTDENATYNGPGTFHVRARPGNGYRHLRGPNGGPLRSQSPFPGPGAVACPRPQAAQSVRRFEPCCLALCPAKRL